MRTYDDARKPQTRANRPQKGGVKISQFARSETFTNRAFFCYGFGRGGVDETTPAAPP